MGNADLTYDLSKVTTLRGLMKTLFNFERITRSGMLPAIVTKVNEGHTVDCIILCNKAKIEDGKIVNFKRETVKEVPWMQVMHGGYLIDCPISEGDTGWIIAGDRQNRDIREKNANIDPNENEGPQDLSSYGIGKFEFGLFIPDNWTSDSPAKDGNFIIRNLKKDDRIDTEDVYGIYKKYPWSLIEIEKGGMVNIYGQGKKFTVREEGLYLDDKPLTFEGMTLTGNTKESVKITGDVSVESKLKTEEGEEYDGEIIAETVIDEEAADDSSQKSRLNLNLKLPRKKASTLNHDGEEVFTSDIYAENDMLVVPDYGVEFEESTIGDGDGERSATLVKLLLTEGLGIDITDDENTFAKKIKNTGVISLTGSGIITVTNGQNGVWNVYAPSPEIPEVNDGVLTIKNSNGTSLGSFSANQATDSSISIPAINNGVLTITQNGTTLGTFSANQDGNTSIEIQQQSSGVASVDVKSGTNGLSISPTTGNVKVENTGLTGIHIQQSGENRYAQITGGTDTTHGGTTVKTKDITLTLPVEQYIEATEEEGDIDCIRATLTQAGTAEGLNLVENVSLMLDSSAANCTFTINDVDVAEFFGTDDIDFGEKRIVGENGINVETEDDVITVSYNGSTSGYSGSITVVVEADYNSPSLRQHKKSLTFENGLLTASGVSDLGWSEITRAVEES